MEPKWEILFSLFSWGVKGEAQSQGLLRPKLGLYKNGGIFFGRSTISKGDFAIKSVGADVFHGVLFGSCLLYLLIVFVRIF